VGALWHLRDINDFTDEDKKRYVTEFQRTGLRTRSADRIGWSVAVIKKIMEIDPDFVAAIDQAYEMYKDSLCEELTGRAVEGWDEPVFFRGEQCGVIRRKSDRLFEVLLKRHVPEFRDHQKVDVSVAGGVLVVPSSGMSVESWEGGIGAVEANLISELGGNEKDLGKISEDSGGGEE